MNSNVHALELGRAPKRVDVGRPDRADVETAFRTIIRWAGDDPERPGLIETPARVARAFEEFFAGYGQDPALILEKTFEEIEGYDEMIVLRGIRFESHCEHHMAPITGQGLGGVRPERSGRRDQQACQGCGCLCEAPANSGKNDGADCQHDQRGPQTSGGWRHSKGDASLHDHARRA